MHNRTKAVAIPKEVREAVEKRDGYRCIFCGSGNARGEAHYVNRSQGGLGIEQNIVTVCRNCHREMDTGKNTKFFREIAKEYLKSKYPGWDEKKLVYNKWDFLKS